MLVHNKNNLCTYVGMMPLSTNFIISNLVQNFQKMFTFEIKQMIDPGPSTTDTLQKSCK